MKCPVTRTNRKKWTTNERKFAKRADTVRDVNDLKVKLAKHHGRAFPNGTYLTIDSTIAEGQTLKFLDASNQFVGLLLTNMTSIVPHCNDDIMGALEAHFGDNLGQDTSDRSDYEFLSLHYSWYNRYSEKGDGAPLVHPHYVYKNGSVRVNNSQRVPRCSKEIQDDPQEHDLLAKILRPVFKFVDANTLLTLTYTLRAFGHLLFSTLINRVISGLKILTGGK
ncbi:hypothetical protein H0H93_009152 [Arthromyces matolae]|nr:hypothetical protein H0H93_009152 [Arthromyces matolae]